MGEALYAKLGEDRPDIAHRTTRRLAATAILAICAAIAENGATRPLSRSLPTRCAGVAMLWRPADIIGRAKAAIPTFIPRDLYGPKRKNFWIEFMNAALEQPFRRHRRSTQRGALPMRLRAKPMRR
jgi:RHH-type proline utilization regulon transcriptional repressor/proline dehydrogenase/delta 1-pyrroline-5-carboxylate dehydrogenase